MKTAFNKALVQIKEFWVGQTKKQKKTLIISVIIGLALIVALTILFNSTKYEVLYTDLDAAESGKILSVLEEMSVDAKVKGSDTILVDENQADRIRMVLASQGYPKSTLDYDVFSGNINFLTTDFEKNQYRLFQLQERLQASIKTLDGIKSAIVTISLPDNTYAVLQTDKVSPSASVVLSADYNAQLTGKQISGIEQLVVKSVPGLTKENVSIIDNNGSQLNGSEESNSVNNLELETTVRSDVQKRVKEVLSPIYAADEMSVGVNVKMDFDESLTEKTTYGDNAVTDEDNHYEGTTPQTADETGVPVYNTGDESGNNPYYVQDSVKSYLVDTTVEQISKAKGTITDLTVSVLLDRNELSDQELQRVKEVIAKTCGIEEAKIYVGNAQFSNKEDTANSDTDKDSLRKSGLFGMSPVSTYIIIGALLIVIVLILIIITIAKRPEEDDAFTQAMGNLNHIGTPQSESEQENENIDLIMKETKEHRMKKQIQEFASTNPEIAAQLIKTLLKGDSE